MSTRVRALVWATLSGVPAQALSPCRVALGLRQRATTKTSAGSATGARSTGAAATCAGADGPLVTVGATGGGVSEQPIRAPKAMAEPSTSGVERMARLIRPGFPGRYRRAKSDDTRGGVPIEISPPS
ncbi:MAG: hypothetical protein QM820_50880 [Minicystis sp.]